MKKKTLLLSAFST